MLQQSPALQPKSMHSPTWESAWTSAITVSAIWVVADAMPRVFLTTRKTRAAGCSALIAKMAKRLESTPEGDGNMLENTVIVYMSDAPDTHHSTGYEWPLAIVGNLKGKMNLGGRYINFPGYGKPGHHTVGALYTTFLNCIGQPQQTFGYLDPDLDTKAMQTGPLADLLV